MTMGSIISLMGTYYYRRISWYNGKNPSRKLLLGTLLGFAAGFHAICETI